jgi:Bacterial PH domain
MSPQPWRIRRVLPAAKLFGAVAIVVLVLVFGRDDPVQWFLAVAVGLGLAGWALRDLIAPVRLAADPDGVTVIAGFAGRRRLAWSQIERVRIDRRARLGVRTGLATGAWSFGRRGESRKTGMLEVDAGDNVYLFSRYDLGAEPEDVLASLLALRSARPSGTSPAQ